MAKRYRGGLVKANVEVEFPDNFDFSELNRAVNEDLDGIATRVRDRAKGNVGGAGSLAELSASIKKRKKDADTYVVEAKHPLAHLREFGTDPHQIKPRRSKVLAWSSWGVASVRAGSFSQEAGFATVVEHPGAAAKPYLRPALEVEISELVQRG